MQIALVAPATDHATVLPAEPYAGWAVYRLDDARGDLNAVISELVHVKQGAMPAPDVLIRQLKLMTEARTRVEDVLGHDATADAREAAHNVLPHLTRAAELMHTLGKPTGRADLKPLIDDLGAAMDHIEALLGAVGFD
ncbi:MAG: hypothetical protein H7123_00755 [Thermoleophilia bacterium]|nr:hypothetical protein [Thermoleophilia bacterium]